MPVASGLSSSNGRLAGSAGRSGPWALVFSLEPSLGSRLPVKVVEGHTVWPAERPPQCLQIHAHEDLPARPVELVAGSLEVGEALADGGGPVVEAGPCCIDEREGQGLVITDLYQDVATRQVAEEDALPVHAQQEVTERLEQVVPGDAVELGPAAGEVFEEVTHRRDTPGMGTDVPVVERVLARMTFEPGHRIGGINPSASQLVGAAPAAHALGGLEVVDDLLVPLQPIG